MRYINYIYLMKYWTLMLFLQQIAALPTIIRIGGIFGQFEENQELAFRYAVESINMDRTILQTSKLHATIVRIPADDSFQASKKVCQLMRSGVAAIFGPKNEKTANHVQSICDALEIPHIETRWKYRLTQDTYSVNLYPHPTSLSTAYHDVIKKLGWASFTIIYDSNESLIRLQNLLKIKKWDVDLCYLTGNDYRSALRELKKFKVTKLVVDVSQYKIYNVLKQAAQIGLMTEHHNYFIISLDLNLVNMDEFRYGGTNITALRLIDPTKGAIKKLIESWSVGERRFPHEFSPEMKSITTESALMYDAVYLFAHALDDLNRSRVVDIVPLQCDAGKTWSHGNSLINLMKWYSSHRYNNQSESYPPTATFPSLHRIHMAGYTDNMPRLYNLDHATHLGFASTLNQPKYGDLMSRGFELVGITGLIKFDIEGFRSDFELQITELEYDNGITQVGVWTPSGGANYSRTTRAYLEEGMGNLRNKSIVVTSALASPYTMEKMDSKQLTGNDRYEGFCIDLIDRISKLLGFNYTIKLAPGSSYGRKDPITGQFDGMIGELLNHTADLAIVDFTITYEREEVVDFSMPFMNLGIGIIYRKPQKQAPELFTFMSPFSTDVWMYMAAAYLGVSVVLFMLARISPNEWDNPSPCIQDPDELENAITLNNAFWFTIGSLMQQGSDIAPKAVSTRIVASIWWFFTLIMISSYTANLAAFLVVERIESPIDSAKDLSEQSEIKYGCKSGGSTFSFFEKSKIDIYESMYRTMNSTRSTSLVETNEEGVDRVSNSNGKYAFLMESSSIEYVIERRCDLTQIGNRLDAKSYGIALRTGSPFTADISSAILKLKETGVLHEFKTKWWKEQRGGGSCQNKVSSSTSSKAAELGLANVGGVFVVLIGGMGVSAIFALIEFFWNARELATDENATFCEELGKEVKFIIKCSGNTKPARKPGPSTPEEPLFTYGSYNADSYGWIAPSNEKNTK